MQYCTTTHYVKSRINTQRLPRVLIGSKHTCSQILLSTLNLYASITLDVPLGYRQPSSHIRCERDNALGTAQACGIQSPYMSCNVVRLTKPIACYQELLQASSRRASHSCDLCEGRKAPQHICIRPTPLRKMYLLAEYGCESASSTQPRGRGIVASPLQCVYSGGSVYFFPSNLRLLFPHPPLTAMWAEG